MRIVKFESRQSLEASGEKLLADAFSIQRAGPHAVMMTGGRTPLGIYARLANVQSVANRGLHVLVSDERHVPPGTPDHNFSKMLPMLNAVGVEESRRIYPRTELALQDAADGYDLELREFFRGGRITLAILGLGADGHLASLFNAADLQAGEGRYAIAVRREPGPHRISVTREVLTRAERIVFIVAGSDKREIVAKAEADMAGVVAVEATRGLGAVELWYAPR